MNWYGGIINAKTNKSAWAHRQGDAFWSETTSVCVCVCVCVCVYKCSFFPQTIRDWNILPDFLISSAEIAEDCVAKFTSLVRARD